MIRFVPVLLVVLGIAAGSASAAEPPKVRLATSMGDIVLELAPDKAPRTVENFLAYVRSGFYDGTIFHRVMPDFVIQGGGFTPEFDKKKTQPPVQNEADNGLKNDRGSISMARTGDPHSATSQFFINVKDNSNLNHREKTRPGWGYAVFGRVVDGMDVIDSIRAVPTGSYGYYQNVPLEPIVIRSAVVEAAKTTE